MKNEADLVNSRPLDLQNGTPNFMPRMDVDTLRTLLPVQPDVIITIRPIEPELTGNHLKESVAELLPPSQLFGDKRRQIIAIYLER